MRTMVLTICAALGLQSGPVWAAVDTRYAPAGLQTQSRPAPRATTASTTGDIARLPDSDGRTPGRSATSSRTYAAREADHPELKQFKGGSSSIYIGGSTVVIILLVVLLIVLL